MDIELRMILLIAEGRPCYLFLTLAIDTKPSSLETVSSIVNDVSSIHNQRSTLSHLNIVIISAATDRHMPSNYLDIDQTSLWSVDNLKPVGFTRLPSV